MDMAAGVYQAKKKNGEIYFRSSITYKNRHISLGSFETEEKAHEAYREAEQIVRDGKYRLEDYHEDMLTLSFDKFVVLVNFRDNEVYIKNPIYLRHKFFYYFLTEEIVLKFDVDDLFYYSEHKIMRRGSHLFVADFGMQVTLSSRYGIKNYAVEGRDYRFVNGDSRDYRYGNIEIFTRYHGVIQKKKGRKDVFEARIHRNGDWILGRYQTETEAAVAYNKGARYLWEHGETKKFPVNYIEELDGDAYKEMLEHITISKRFRESI
jgi:hypothetical protein